MPAVSNGLAIYQFITEPPTGNYRISMDYVVDYRETMVADRYLMICFPTSSLSHARWTLPLTQKPDCSESVYFSGHATADFAYTNTGAGTVRVYVDCYASVPLGGCNLTIQVDNISLRQIL